MNHMTHCIAQYLFCLSANIFFGVFICKQQNTVDIYKNRSLWNINVLSDVMVYRYPTVILWFP